MREDCKFEKVVNTLNIFIVATASRILFDILRTSIPQWRWFVNHIAHDVLDLKLTLERIFTLQQSCPIFGLF